MQDVKETQGNVFIQKARELECDESEEVFNEKLKKISEVKPEQLSEKDD